MKEFSKVVCPITRIRVLAILALVVILSVYREAPAKAYQPASPEISFTVSMPRPWTHLLEVEMLMRVLTGEDSEKYPFVGGTFSDDDGKLTVRSVGSDTPAYSAGLNAGDEIVAIDGYRANSYFVNREGYRENTNFFKEYLKEKQPGDKIRLTVFRFDTLREIVIELAGRADADYRIVPVENPTDDQKRLYRQYLSAELN